MVRLVYHWLRDHYYTGALRYLSMYEPFHPDMLEIIIKQTRSRAIVRGWIHDAA
jgi:hypothetical protein